MRKIFKLFSLFIMLISVLTLTSCKEEKLPEGIDFDATIKSVAHRGYSIEAPENTLPAYELAKEKGFKYVECDISFTKDNIPVLLHDSSINRTSDGRGKISDLTYEQAYQYDYGKWKHFFYTNTKLPTFEEFLDLCIKLELHPYIELKSNDDYSEEQIRSLVKLVEEKGLKGKVTWISFSAKFIEYVKNADDSARLGYVVDDVTPEVIAKALELKTENNSVFIDSKFKTLTPERIQMCKDNNIPLEVWTVNDEEAIINMDPYISGITSDKYVAGYVRYKNNK